MLAEIAGQDIADGIEIGAAVMGHDALWVARGAGGIAERDRVPFVGRQPCDEAGIALRDGRFVLDLTNPLAARKRRVVDIDDEGFRPLHQRQRFRDHAAEFGIDQDDFRAAMVELEGNRRRVEPDVQRVQHGTRHRNGEMHLVHGRDIRQHRRYGVAIADTAAGKPRRKTPAALIGFGPRKTAIFIDRADMIGIDGGAAREEAERRQRNVIGRRLVQSD